MLFGSVKLSFVPQDKSVLAFYLGHIAAVALGDRHKAERDGTQKHRVCQVAETIGICCTGC